jgi:DNA-binding Lrp family transcriptional regulator
MSKTVLTEVDGWTPLIDVITEKHGVIASAIFGRMWRYCQMSDKICRASQETIANELHVSRKTVNEQIEILVNNGYLEDTTPDVRNRPHIYADTGKAGLRLAIVGGVTESYTSPKKTALGVTVGYSTVTESDSRCNPGLQQGVTVGYSKKESLRDSLRDELKINGLTPKQIWEHIDQQLRNEVGNADYLTWVQPLKAADMSQGKLVVRAVNSYGRDWCESHLGVKVSRLATALVGQETNVVFALESAQ